MKDFDLQMVIHVACVVLILYNMCYFTVVLRNRLKETFEHDLLAEVTPGLMVLICIYSLILVLSGIALTYIFSIHGWVLGG